MNASEEMTCPSRTKRGSFAASPSRKDEFPLIRISGFVPRSPLFVTTRPGAEPWSATDMSTTGLSCSLLTSTVLMTPDLERISRSLIFCFPVTTAPSIMFASSSRITVTSFCPVYEMVWDFIPRKDTSIRISFLAGSSMEKYPLMSVDVPVPVSPRTQTLAPARGSSQISVTLPARIRGFPPCADAITEKVIAMKTATMRKNSIGKIC